MIDKLESIILSAISMMLIVLIVLGWIVRG